MLRHLRKKREFKELRSETANGRMGEWANGRDGDMGVSGREWTSKRSARPDGQRLLQWPFLSRPRCLLCPLRPLSPFRPFARSPVRRFASRLTASGSEMEPPPRSA
jgi:hypothetical protein